jgi:hypothetical protein
MESLRVDIASTKLLFPKSFIFTVCSKKRENISLGKCIVCQRVSLEQTVNMNDFGKSSFVEAMSTRKDSIFEKVIQFM